MLNFVKNLIFDQNRDEQLFETARQVIFFFISLYIIVSLTYYCRDRYGYYYQKQVKIISKSK